MIAAILVRKSNDEGDGSNADVKSISVQREACARFAASRGWTVDDRYVYADDAVSGATFDRPGLKALLAAAATKPAPFQKLIVTEQSRIGRDTVGTLVVVQQLEDAGIEIWSAGDGRPITLADESNEIMTLLGAWRDKAERRKTITRVRRAAFNQHEKGYVAGGVVYGYRNERLPGAGKQPVRRVIDEAQAVIVHRIFTETRDGRGLIRIASRLNAEGVPGPRGQWSATGVREILHRDLYRGVEIFGRVKRTGPKTRVAVPESEWKRREDESLRIVDGILWDAAHARKAQTAGSVLRRRGKLMGKAESLRGKYLLSGHVACGVCWSPMIATQRGRNLVPSYVCSAHRTKGSSVCANTTAVPVERLHAGVIASLRDTLTPENFERLLKTRAADAEARASRQAERANLLDLLPKLAAAEQRLVKRIATIEDDALVAALKEEWSAAKAEREQAEARVAQIEGEERDLRAESDAVERLRAAWKDWSGALDAEPGLARQLLRKVLACPIAVFPRGRGQWSFGGYSRFDSLLTGRITPEQTLVAKWTNREAIDALVRSHPEWIDPGVSAWAAAPIAGGSDCTSMRDPSRPPI